MSLRPCPKLGALCLLLAATTHCGEAAPGANAAGADTPPLPRVAVVETDPLHIDRLYPSMTGPSERVPLDASGLDWVTAIKTEIIDQADGRPMGGEYFCHSQLQTTSGQRLTVSYTGGEELRLPPGFAIPASHIFAGVPADQRELTFFGMILNNHDAVIDRMARIRATVEYYSDEDVGGPDGIQSIYMTNAAVSVQDIAEYKPIPGLQINPDVTTHCSLVAGKKVHWMVPPGPQLTRKTLHNLVPVDSTVHVAQAHMHNYGRYVKLTDLTTGELVWRADIEYEPDRMQIARIPAYSSAEGLPIHAEHQYEIEAYYDNTTDHDVDAMAAIYLYFHPDGNEQLTLPKPSGGHQDG